MVHRPRDLARRAGCEVSAPITVLDHGYVRVVEAWGSDATIVEAARMSTQKGATGWGTPEAPGDEKLLKYLWKNNHATPFEFAGVVIEVRAPVIVFREWHRHRTQSYNEASARYAPLPSIDYMPTVDRLMVGGGHLTKQAAGADGATPLTAESAEWFRGELARVQADAERVYQEALARGIPKELARLSMTVGRYSTMRAHANLRNWLGFCTLRMAPNAQAEIRAYANVVGEVLAEAFPRTWALFSSGLGAEAHK